MPLGRIYQAPTTVARNTPVFGYNGLKSVSNSDLVITGQAVRNKKSKSPSPSAKPSPIKATSNGSTSASPKLPSISPPRQNGSRKSPSPGLRAARPPGQTPKARLKVAAAARENRTNNTNKNLNDNSTSNGSELCDTCHKTHCEHDDVSSELDNATRAKSWSPEAEVDKKIANDNDSVTEDAKHEDERLHNGNGNSARHSQASCSWTKMAGKISWPWQKQIR